MLEFEETFSLLSLNRTFDTLLERRYDVIYDRTRILAGADRIELEHFERDREKHLSAIHRKVIQKRYTFSPFLGIEIPKHGSKDTRPISLSTIRDTIVQRALYDYLYPRINVLLTDSAFGYRSKLSAHDAIRSIGEHVTTGRGDIVDVDLTKFFDNVRHKILLEKVTALEIDDRAQRLVYRFLRTGRVDAETVVRNRKSDSQPAKQSRYHALLRGVGVPQGGVLSGLLSNLYLAEFDRAIRKRFLGYVRYADDFVVCCTSKSDCKSALNLIREELQKLDLELNNKKTTEWIPITKGIDFLGFHINNKQIRVRGSNVGMFKNRIKGIINNQNKLSNPEATLGRLIYRLNFKIRGPNEGQQEKLRSHANIECPHRRSWVGYFRIVTDIEQIRKIDRWIRSEISNFMWKTHRRRVKYHDLQEAGLLSLVNYLFRARR